MYHSALRDSCLLAGLLHLEPRAIVVQHHFGNNVPIEVTQRELLRNNLAIVIPERLECSCTDMDLRAQQRIQNIHCSTPSYAF